MPLHSQSDEVEWLHRHNPFNLLSVRDRINLNLSFEIFRRLDYRVPIASSTSMQINILYLGFFLQQKDNCISQPGSLLCCFLSTVCCLQFGSENIVKKLLLGELQGMTNNFAFMFWGPWAPYLTARVGCTLLLCWIVVATLNPLQLMDFSHLETYHGNFSNPSCGIIHISSTHHHHYPTSTSALSQFSACLDIAPAVSFR